MSIFLRLEMVSVSRAEPSSLRVCHTLGNGETIRWTMGTPERGRGGEGRREERGRGGRGDERKIQGVRGGGGEVYTCTYIQGEPRGRGRGRGKRGRERQEGVVYS